MEPKDVIAVVAIGATGLTALASIVYQAWAANAAARRERRRNRYDELVRVYDAAGRDLTGQIAGFRAAVVQFRLLGRPLTTEQWTQAINEQMDKGELDQSGHPQNVVHLYGAPPRVQDALRSCEAEMQKLFDQVKKGEVKGLDNAAFCGVESAVERFYTVAGEHAREELRSY